MKKQLPPEHNIIKPRTLIAVTGLAVGAATLLAYQVIPQQDAERTSTHVVSDKQVFYTAKSIAQLPHQQASDDSGHYETSISKDLPQVDDGSGTVNYDIRMTSVTPETTPQAIELKNILAITCSITTADDVRKSGSVTIAPDPRTGQWTSQGYSLGTEDDQFCFAVINQIVTA